MFIKEKKGPKIYAAVGTNTWYNNISLTASSIVGKRTIVLESVVKYSKYRKVTKNR